MYLSTHFKDFFRHFFSKNQLCTAILLRPVNGSMRNCFYEHNFHLISEQFLATPSPFLSYSSMFIHSVPPREELTTSPCTTQYALPSFWEHIYSCIFIPNSGFHKNVDIFLSTLHIFINFLFAFKCPVPYVNVTHRYEVGKNTYFSATPCISYREAYIHSSFTYCFSPYTYPSSQVYGSLKLHELYQSTVFCLSFLSLRIIESCCLIFTVAQIDFPFFFARTSHKISELSSLSRIFCSKSLSSLTFINVSSASHQDSNNSNIFQLFKPY